MGFDLMVSGSKNISVSNEGSVRGVSHPKAGRIPLSQGRRCSGVRTTWWHETMCDSKSLHLSVRCSQ